ncbi:MAG: carboxypeptidase regulatory-like domain-containing protein [Bryobacteraceae bacterium]
MLSQRVLRLALSIFVCALALTAQTGNGRVQGVVKDASSAVVGGAKVTIAHTATMTRYSTTTNDEGLFVFPPSQPGAYSMTVGAPGMETWQGTFLMEVGQTVDVSPTLRVGAVSTQVVVAGEAAPLVSTTDATLSEDLERTRIEQLPSDGRNIANLVMMAAPGFNGGQDGNINPINMGLRDGVELYQDGAIVKNRDTGDWAGRLPGVDSVQELRVETNGSSAQFDRPGSVILSTKSGANDVHGSVFETARNSAIGVARQRQATFTKAPYYNRHEYGGSLGGPVKIPKIYNGKNRTFFFTTYEGLRLESQSTYNTSMQTDAMRQGDYSGLVDNLGRLTTIYDPLTTGPAPTWTRTPFPNNTIPISRESPDAKYLFSILPQPTLPNVNPLLASNWYGVVPSTTTDFMLTERIDQRVSDRDQVFGRVSVGHDRTSSVSAGGSTQVPPLSGTLNYVSGEYHDVSAVASWTHTISPTFVSAARLSWSQEYKFTGSPYNSSIGNVSEYLGVPDLNNDPNNSYSTTGMGFGASFATQQVRHNTTRILFGNEDLTRMVGRHQLLFGGQLHLEFDDALTDHNGTGITYDTLATALFNPASGSAYSAQPLTGFSGADFFMGYVSTFKDTVKRPQWNLRDREFAGYFQDNWRVTSRLTLNLGLRYQDMPAESIAGNYNVGFDLNTDSMVLGRSVSDMYAAGMTTPTIIGGLTAIGAKFETAQQAGLPPGLIYGNPWIFEPRVGFAYRTSDSVRPVVLRGGWGIYDSQAALRTWDNLTGSGIPYGYPVQYSVNNQALVGVNGIDGLPNYELRSVPQFVAGTNTANVLSNPAFVSITPGCCALQFFDPHEPPTRDMQWNFSVAKETFSGIVASATYLATHGWNIPQNVNFNAAPSNYVWYATTGEPLVTGTYASTGENPYNTTTYGSMTEYMKQGISNAEGFTLEVKRRYSHGVGWQFMYVMTNAFTESTLVGNGGGSSVAPAADFLPGAVSTDFDARNHFLNYQRDSAIPHNQLKWNWVVDLPFGRDHLLAHNAGKALNALIGGWQLAGFGTYQSRYFSLPTSNYGPTSQIQTYGTKYKIEDCSSGTCLPGYLYWNGYISPPQINRGGTSATGPCTGICGIPANYTPSNLPLIPYGATSAPNAPAGTNMASYWETQTVWLPLKNGSVVQSTMNTGLTYWMNQYVAAPWDFNLSASLFKVFSLSERFKLRFNADFFQVLNNPGIPLPGSNGIMYTNTSLNSPRDLQLTLRLTW